MSDTRIVRTLRGCVIYSWHHKLTLRRSPKWRKNVPSPYFNLSAISLLVFKRKYPKDSSDYYWKADEQRLVSFIPFFRHIRHRIEVTAFVKGGCLISNTYSICIDMTMVFVSSCFWLHLTKMQFKSSLSNKEQVLAYHFCMFKMCGSPQVYILKIPQQTVKKKQNKYHQIMDKMVDNFS